MNFNFHLRPCAQNNSPVARARESMRLGCIALGMASIGHRAAIVDAPDELKSTPRWAPFAPHVGQLDDAIEVWPAEMMRGRDGLLDVGFKCSVGIDRDSELLKKFRLLVAHEYNPVAFDAANLLRVPFMVHDSVMDELLKDELFDSFIANELDKIRAFYGRPKDGLLGMKACVHHHRRRFCEDAPAWADLSFYTYQPTEGLIPGEHMRWIAGFKGGLSLPGTTPKTNLPCLLAMLGVAIVSPPFPPAIKDTPPITRANAIIFESWEQARAELEDDARLSEVIKQATSDYINCWSPAGQARLIAERFL